MTKKVLVLFFALSIGILGLSLQAQASLQTIGTATYGGSEYNMIYDSDQQLTWLDYTNGWDDWTGQNNWAAGLNTSGVLTYNFNAGVTMNWDSTWRLPTTVDGPWVRGYDGTTTAGYNITSSEMGYLFYVGLGNTGGYDTSGNMNGCFDSWPSYCLTKTGDFQNLVNANYWSITEYATDPDDAWYFTTDHGYQDTYFKTYSGLGQGIAVRSGQLTVVPEPISSTLFILGGATLGFMRFRKKIKK